MLSRLERILLKHIIWIFLWMEILILAMLSEATMIPITFTIHRVPGSWSAVSNPHTKKWDGPDADYTPVSDDIPWMMVPEKKITVEDVKYVLSSHYQGTPYDRMAAYGEKSWKGHTAPSVSTGPISFLSSRCARITKETTAFCSGSHLRRMRSMCWFRSTPM